MDQIHGARNRPTDGLPTESTLRPVILESWRRSQAAGVAQDPEHLPLSRVAEDDLQQRLQANAALLTIARPHLEWASTVLSQVPHIVYLTDREGILLYATGSQAQRGDLGLAAGFNWSEQAAGTNGAGTALAANQPVAVVGMEHFNRRLHDYHCTAAPVHTANGAVIGVVALRTSVADGNPERVALVASLARMIDQEVTRQTETVGVESHQGLLAAIVESCDDAIIGKTLDGTILSWNRGAERLYGYAAEEVRGQSIALLIPPNHPDELPVIMDRLRRGERIDHFETVRVCKDGGRVEVSVSISPIRDATGKIVGASAIARDLSERRRAEQLAEANRRKDEFLSLLCHELRNPLASVRHGLQVMGQLGKADTPAEQVRAVMERQVRHLSRLVDDLLDVSRITLGAIRLRKERVSLSRLVQEAVEISRPVLEDRRHALEVSLPPHQVWLEADPVRLIQILTNLLDNAAQYSEEGGRIWLRAGREGGEVVLRVRDAGMGISAERLAYLFEPYQTAGRTPGRPPGSLGIGLSLVRRLVDLHGGAVEASSPGLGQGSEFVVRLPLVAAERPGDGLPKALEPIRPVVNCPKRRILVVDDDRDAARIIAAFLRLEGHEVRVASSGFKALALVQEELPEVILLDLGMPGMDGYEVAHRLRAPLASKGVLLVALTGYGQEEDRRRCRQAGFDGHLVKPVEPDELKHLLAHGKSGGAVGPTEGTEAR